MKKLLFIAAASLMAVSANAQKMKEAEVPANIKSAFSAKFPNAKVEKWEKEGNNYEAEFTQNKVETSAEFGPNGQWIATETEINVSELPKAISDYCTKNMPGKKIKEASKITSADGSISYEAEVDEADYIFDAKGNFLKKEVEKDGDKDDDKK